MVVGFIGAGNMGGAYINALNKELYFYETNKERIKELEENTLGKGVKQCNRATCTPCGAYEVLQRKLNAALSVSLLQRVD